MLRSATRAQEVTVITYVRKSTYVVRDAARTLGLTGIKYVRTYACKPRHIRNVLANSARVPFFKETAQQATLRMTPPVAYA